MRQPLVPGQMIGFVSNRHQLASASRGSTLVPMPEESAEPSGPPLADHVQRAMTNDGSFRVLTASTTETVRAVVAAQSVAGETVAEIANVITATVLVRETMSPENRVQILYRDANGSQLVGDSYPEGKTRGLVRIKSGARGIEIGAGGVLQVERIVRQGKSHQGLVSTADGDELVVALRNYFLQSEQVTTMVDLASVVRDGDVVGAGGYVVQLLPELTDPPLQAMNERLADIGRLEGLIEVQGAGPGRIMKAILGEGDHTLLADSPVSFHCPCDRQRVRVAAAALGRDEIEKLMADEEDLSISCDYCREPYTLVVDDYRHILDQLDE